MTVQLNIKDPKTTALVTELAEITGRSKTEAIRLAVEAALAREKGGKMRRSNGSLPRSPPSWNGRAHSSGPGTS